jgi:hypothetical protein
MNLMQEVCTQSQALQSFLFMLSCEQQPLSRR